LRLTNNCVYGNYIDNPGIVGCDWRLDAKNPCGGIGKCACRTIELLMKILIISTEWYVGKVETMLVYLQNKFREKLKIKSKILGWWSHNHKVKYFYPFN
jgi:hypothetical protein